MLGWDVHLQGLQVNEDQLLDRKVHSEAVQKQGKYF